MTCANCHWWRPHPDTPQDDGVPAYGRCIAMAPSPEIMTVVDVDEWNKQTMVVVWPQTRPGDHCAAHVPRNLVDQETGRFKVATVPDGYEDGDETMQ